MKQYTAINIGPISHTFSMARKPREFWLASYLFSHFMKCLINAISEKVEIMSPYVPNEELGRVGVGLFPDRAFFKSTDDIDIDALIKSGVFQFSKDIQQPVETVQDYFNVMSVSISTDSDNKAIKELNEYLNYLELTNHAHSSQTAERMQTFITKTDHSPLFEIAFGNQTFNIGSLEEIATTELNFNKKVSRKSYHDYICIVQADGDNMGKVVTHLPENTIYQISEQLMKFGKEACELITDFGGLPIYAGGDDLLFIAPVCGNQSNSIFHLISSIDHAYRNIANEVSKLNIKDEQGLPIHTSMSYGLSITYYKYPLYEAWKIAGNQLFGIAKDKERHGGLKNAIAWKIQKHSGSTYEGSFSKSEAGLYDAFTHILYTLSKDRLVSAVAHKIRSNENLLALLNTEDNDMLAVRIKAFFDHVVDIEDKTPATIQYIQQVKTLLMQLYQSLHEQKIKDIPALISCAYGMLRTAKFINGEEERI